jgi:hypothetical protein
VKGDTGMESEYYSSMVADMLKDIPYSDEAKNAIRTVPIIFIADELHEMNKNLEKLIDKIGMEGK